MPQLRQLGRATHPGGAATDHRDAFAGFFRRRLQDLDPVFVNMIRRVALEPADFDRVAVAIKHHAGAFAEDLGRADARAAGAQDVGGEDGARGAGDVAGHDFLDEGRDVDAGRAGRDAGGIETEETTRRLDDRLLFGVAGRDVGEVGLELIGV